MKGRMTLLKLLMLMMSILVAESMKEPCDGLYGGSSPCGVAPYICIIYRVIKEMIYKHYNVNADVPPFRYPLDLSLSCWIMLVSFSESFADFSGSFTGK